MKKRLLLVAGLLTILTGCGQQPELEVNADQNQTQKVEPKKEVQQPQQQVEVNQTQPTETDLTDTTVVQVSENSMENNDTNNSSQEELNQNTAQALSAEVVHFDFDKYNIRKDQLPIVQEVANIIKDAKGNFTVRIEGNCDEWGSDEYNYALGLKRAKIVKQALIDLGVDGSRLTIISYGKSNPVCTAHAKWCWAKNRRDNFTLLP